MSRKSTNQNKWFVKFFSISLAHETLANYYVTNFTLMYDHNLNSLEWDSIPPFEKQIYIDLLISRLEEKKKNAEQ